MKNNNNAEKLLKELDAQFEAQPKQVKESKKKVVEPVIVTEPEAKSKVSNKKQTTKEAKIIDSVKDVPVETIEELANRKPDQEEINRARKLLERDNAIQAEDNRQFLRSIPGYGYLFGIRKEFLPESTNIDKGQAWTLAGLYMQMDMINTDRTEDIRDMFACRLMRFQNSIEGKSRVEVLHARQQEADKQAATMARGELSGGRF